MCQESKPHPKYQTLYRAENIHTADTKVELELQSKPKIYNQIFNLNQSKNLNPKISVRFGFELQSKRVEFPNPNILERKLHHSAHVQSCPVMLWKNLNQTTRTETRFAHPELECLCGAILWPSMPFWGRILLKRSYKSYYREIVFCVILQFLFSP